ncbi:MAG: hypothetical protein WD273_09750 [Trueperaceae bacterium]
MKTIRLVVVLVVTLTLLLAGCRNETQNRIRRNIQDFANTRMYITLYSHEGPELFNGVVDGKVTRSGAENAEGTGAASGDYVFWYDERGRYHQSDLPYLVTTYDRRPGAAIEEEP